MTQMIQCPFCRGEIDVQAAKCKHCGEWVKPDAKTVPPTVGLDYVGAFLSFLICGLGQVKQVRILAGLLFFLGGYGLILAGMGGSAPILIAGLAIYGWSIMDAGYFPQRKWLREHGR